MYDDTLHLGVALLDCVIASEKMQVSLLLCPHIPATNIRGVWTYCLIHTTTDFASEIARIEIDFEGAILHSSFQVSRREAQLIGVACLLIATKVSIVSVSDIVPYS